jgi:hypothetical protein
LLLKQREGRPPLPIMRADVGNQVSLLLLADRRAVEVPCGLNKILESLPLIAAKNCDGFELLCRKLEKICEGDESHPRLAVKVCLMVLVDDTLAKAQAVHDELSVDSKIEEIRTTIHQSLDNFTFATHTFAQIADAVGYLTDEYITSEVMQPLIDE